MVPLSGFKNPPIMLSVVVFPQPLGPNSVTNSPWFICKCILVTPFCFENSFFYII